MSNAYSWNRILAVAQEKWDEVCLAECVTFPGQRIFWLKSLIRFIMHIHSLIKVIWSWHSQCQYARRPFTQNMAGIYILKKKDPVHPTTGRKQGNARLNISLRRMALRVACSLVQRGLTQNINQCPTSDAKFYFFFFSSKYFFWFVGLFIKCVHLRKT